MKWHVGQSFNRKSNVTKDTLTDQISFSFRLNLSFIYFDLALHVSGLRTIPSQRENWGWVGFTLLQPETN